MGKSAFHLSELAGQTSHFENEMGFYRESWLKIISFVHTIKNLTDLRLNSFD